jgi:Fe-S-cluster containining protein
MSGKDDRRDEGGRIEDENMAEPEEKTLLEYEKRIAEEERAKREAAADMDLNVFDGVRSSDGNPVQPVKLRESDSFCFSCHKGVSCWNTCCHGADITLTPFDILRLSKRLEVSPTQFLQMFTLPDMWHGANMPVAKLRMEGDEGDGPCVFMDEEDGCTVYEARPVNCRYYPLGLATVKMKEMKEVEDFYFLVREKHCKGHEEEREISVADFRKEQGTEYYDEKNRGWIEILMKLASWKVVGGPGGRDVPDQVKKMFFLATTDTEMFRKFVFETKFLKTYQIDPELVDRLRSDDELLLQLGFDWMKNVIFNEPTIKMRKEVLDDAIAKAREQNPRGD